MVDDGQQVAAQPRTGSALRDAATVAYQTRLTGLAAEASFWGTFALPWLILALVAGIHQAEVLLGIDALRSLRTEILDVASRVLTTEAIDDLLTPMLDSILLQGQTRLGLLGLVAAIWAGSRVIDSLVVGMTIVYRREGLRSFVRTRLVSLGVYVGGLLGLIVAIPLIVAGPTFLARVMPGADGPVMSVALVAIEVGVVLSLVVSLYHWAVPHRTPWWADIPGALIAFGLWVVFSFGLRWYFAWLFREGSVYGVISAPIAIMFWLYVTFLSLHVGAAFNGALALRRGWFQPTGETGVLPVVRRSDEPAPG